MGSIANKMDLPSTHKVAVLFVRVSRESVVAISIWQLDIWDRQGRFSATKASAESSRSDPRSHQTPSSWEPASAWPGYVASAVSVSAVAQMARKADASQSSARDSGTRGHSPSMQSSRRDISFPVPEDVPNESIAPILCGGLEKVLQADIDNEQVTAYKAITSAQVVPGRRIVISGAGGGVGALGVILRLKHGVSCDRDRHRRFREEEGGLFEFGR
ncbi:hypothetical protein CLCR_06198 [Cladophialophora carrionii]|uniref:Uncharacterized protein n=1 Tax=Cladophialophora carrionii TaxID=86049 RepID=A0A1C1C967_9EURO|nr:hypothetical protein CLCR_06198 [Cladophialophora carrionii]